MKQTFNRVGSILWILSIQYFIVQVVVAAAYVGQFSLSQNTISDLGNTVCADFGDRYVCSPLHLLMNISFISLGITQLIGALLLYKAAGRKNLMGFACMMLAGVGTVIVGLYPENTIGLMHGIGAALPFVFGNIAMLFLGTRSDHPAWLKYYSYLSGAVGLTALALFVSHTYLAIGLGGMERVVAYPQTVWMIVLGLYYLRRKPV